MWRLIWFLPMWFVFWILRLALILLGWVLIPLAVHARAYGYRTRMLAGEIVPFFFFTWKFMYIYSNDEEGIAWYGDDDWSLDARIIYSSCYRNPVNNLRYVPYLSCKIDPRKVRYIGKPHFQDPRAYDSDELNFWYFCWHGLYGNFRWHFTFREKRFRAWAGHKIYPGDVYGVFDHRAKSAGFGSQFKRIE
jgi:hypothetical protein